MSMANLQIGTCGFGRVKRPDYVKLLPAVEIQHTFYHPPAIETLEKWRQELPDGFECTLKAWQMITHESSSPTYRRLDRPLTEKEKAEAGFFRPTKTVREASRRNSQRCQGITGKNDPFPMPRPVSAAA